MAVLVDRAKMTVSGTPGTGTITLGTAVTDATNGDFQTFAGAGVANGNSVSYTIVDGHNWEVGRGTYTAAGTTLSRGPLSSSAGGAAITATSAAIVFISALAEDLALLAPLASPTFSGTVTGPDAGTWGVSGIASAAAVGLTSGAFLSWNSDAFLGRAAAANVKYGKDAAAPVAQTISFGNVSTGTSNTVGANATFAGSQGTGTGAGGSLVFSIAPAGSSGTSQNALTSALTIDSTGKSAFASNSASNTPQLVSFLAANTVTNGAPGTGPYLNFGVASSAANSAVLQFTYVANGNFSSNYLGIGLYGGTPYPLTINGTSVQITTLGVTTLNATSVSNGGTFSITNTAAAASDNILSILAPSTVANGAAGTGPFYTVGVANSANNAGAVEFTYAGAGSASNYMSFGIYGTASPFNIYASSAQMTSGNDFYTNNASFILRSKASATGGATGNAPTLTAGPVNGNPTKWLPYDDNGTTRYIPSW